MKKIFGSLLFLVAALCAGCEREFTEPILQEPVYDGPPANMTIAEFRDKFADVSTTPELITVDYIIKGVVTANDVTGNVYKALYIEDETGGLCISIDQTNMYASHRVGQEIYIDLHGLYALKYANALQLGYLNEAASNRVPWEIFIEHEHFDKFPDASRVEPRTLEISKLGSYNPDEILHTLVRFDNVHFQNGGVNPFSSTTQSTSEPLLDASGATLDVRTSNYATFVGETLPVGEGSVIGVLGRFNNTWQLTLRSLDDVLNFPDDVPGEPGPDPGPGPGEEGVIFSETFGNGTHTTTETRPRVADFDGWDEKDVTYTDQSGQVSIRSTSNLSAHAWFPASTNAYLTIAGINTAQYEDLKLTFSLAAQVDAANTATYNFADLMTVTWNDTPLTFTGSTMTVGSAGNNTFYSFEVSTPITATTGNTLQFFASATGNTIGVRLDNIKITGTGDGDGNGHGDGGGTVTPPPVTGDDELLNETFGTENVSTSALRKKIAEYTGYTATNVEYSDPTGYSDIRSTATFDNHVWLPNASGDSPVDSEFVVSKLDASGYTTCTLTFSLAANTYGITGTVDLADMIRVSWNGTVQALPSTPVTSAVNAYTVFTIENLPAAASNTIEFHSFGATSLGLRLDNIKVEGNK